MAKVSVLGAGSWGTALSLLLCKNGHEVTLWSALEDEVRMLCEKREHESKLPGVRLPEDMKITADLEDSLQDPDVAVLAVPSPFTRSTAHRMAPFVKKGQIIVNVAKGVEEHTLMTLSEIISEEIMIQSAQSFEHYRSPDATAIHKRDNFWSDLQICHI